MRSVCLLTSVLALAASLAACTPPTQHWSPAESPKRNTVTWAEYQHDVAFVPRSAEIAPGEQDALHRFLLRVAQGEGVRVFLSAGDGSATPTLALRREAALAAVLRRQGLRGALGGAAAEGSSETVRVTVGRHIVIPPNCPDWSKPAGGDGSNTTSSNFGCATTANLGLMIADPGALVRGYATGPGDGAYLAKGIQNYREGTAPPPAASAAGVTTGGSQSQ